MERYRYNPMILKMFLPTLKSLPPSIKIIGRIEENMRHILLGTEDPSVIHEAIPNSAINIPSHSLAAFGTFGDRLGSF
jgi:hypothetical protein